MSPQKKYPSISSISSTLVEDGWKTCGRLVEDFKLKWKRWKTFEKSFLRFSKHMGCFLSSQLHSFLGQKGKNDEI